MMSYLEVCPLDDTGNPAPCTSDPNEIAAVPVSTANFGPSIFLVDPTPHIPFVSRQTGFLTINAPFTPSEPFIYAIRSSRSGIIAIRDCRVTSCGNLLPETFHVGTDESITVELATESGFGSLNGPILNAHYDDGTLVWVPLIV